MTGFWITGTAALFAAGVAQAQSIPEGYPADYAELISAAETEGSLLIYTNLSNTNLSPVVEAFTKAYPNITMESIEINPSKTFSHYETKMDTNIENTDLIITN